MMLSNSLTENSLVACLSVHVFGCMWIMEYLGRRH